MTGSGGECSSFEDARRAMIETHIKARGIHDSPVLSAMAVVPRELFVPEELRSSAYDDRALPIDERQTISQPYIVAFMSAALRVESHHRILEIGTGSGYQTAVLSQLAAEVHTVERFKALSDSAAKRLATIGIGNVRHYLGDGSVGWRDAAPYDRIIVTAAAPRIPPALIDQLIDGGVLIIPVGDEKRQSLVVVKRFADRNVERVLIPCRFVRLVGRDAWSETS